MAASKRRAVKRASPLPAFLSAALLEAIASSIKALPDPPASLAVAFSGGADSAVLARHAQHYAQEQGITLHCLHIHHGLQEPADAWRAHVHDLAYKLRLPCHSLRVDVAMQAGLGMEAAARDARYAGLERLADALGVQAILLAHHLDDQAETVLLRLLRGAGPGGLGAMTSQSRRGNVLYVRPWLGVERAQILSLAAAHADCTGWFPVADPTNTADQYTRGALRRRLVPHLNERWPAWRSILARHARLSRETAQVLDEVAAADFDSLEPDASGFSFSLALWRKLSEPRQSLVLRYWLARHDLRMPTEARLEELMRQMRQLHALGHDRHMRVRHAGVDILCVKGRVSIATTLSDDRLKNR